MAQTCDYFWIVLCDSYVCVWWDSLSKCHGLFIILSKTNCSWLACQHGRLLFDYVWRQIGSTCLGSLTAFLSSEVSKRLLMSASITKFSAISISRVPHYTPTFCMADAHHFDTVYFEFTSSVAGRKCVEPFVPRKILSLWLQGPKMLYQITWSNKDTEHISHCCH